MNPTELPLTTVWVPRRAGALAAARDLLLVAVAGIAAACIGQLLGRPMRLGLGVPLLGSVLASLPRALVLLLVLARVNRLGAFTGAAVCEVLARAATGIAGLGLMAAVAPLVGGALADIAWHATRRWQPVGARLVLTGAVLAGARVLAAWLLMAWFAFLAQSTVRPAAIVALTIVGLDMLLGASAGLLVAPLRQSFDRWRVGKSRNKEPRG